MASRQTGSLDGNDTLKPSTTATSQPVSDTPDGEEALLPDKRSAWLQSFTRNRYPGALAFNLSTFILPALYGTLSKLWIASIDSSKVATTDSYTYVSVIIEVVNEGLPKAAYLIIGDKASRTLQSRLKLSSTLIVFQTLLGLLVSFIIFGAASKFTGAFVPGAVKEEGVRYVRIAAFSCVFSALDVAVSFATRSLDRPDVPLVISTVNTMLKLLLDLLFISKVRVVDKSKTVEITTQAGIRLACDGASAIVGLLYFIFTAYRMASSLPGQVLTGPDAVILNPSAWAKTKQILSYARPRLSLLSMLAKEGVYFALESGVRNALYLWLVANIVQMGSDYATAWGVFNTIRWGLVMVPVMALDVTSSTFVGHAWGQFRSRLPLGEIGTGTAEKPRANRRQILRITKPALISTGISLVVEVPLCLILGFWGIKSFAFWLSNDEKVADITTHMWKTIDWCYIFYAVNTQLAGILTATKPRWYLYQSLITNLLWVFPWAVVCEVGRLGGKLTGDNAWVTHGLVFGGSLVASFIVVVIVLTIWVVQLMKGKLYVGRVHD
ncbi:hypothetical protein BJ508DRAFT_365399 [Ascobolus immersus RN42]|uniref:MATE efflux family protein n=1 Tax=Ascobolus immersus RN42 TaxID=1160509 RepID=A0A3N4HQ21_ASCIM|nr:hypothetical protein BJ508DRAFT_365399 [Ascobolus immersus RN42]